PDLREALRTLVEDLPGLTVHLALPDRLVIDDAARAHCVLRCVQEIVTNTLRHARADNLWITIEQDDSGITVDTRDDGRGAAAVEPGNGLSGMRARLEELGGFLRIAPAPSFAVTAQLPEAFGSWDRARESRPRLFDGEAPRRRAVGPSISASVTTNHPLGDDRPGGASRIP